MGISSIYLFHSYTFFSSGLFHLIQMDTSHATALKSLKSLQRPVTFASDYYTALKREIAEFQLVAQFIPFLVQLLVGHGFLISVCDCFRLLLCFVSLLALRLLSMLFYFYDFLYAILYSLSLFLFFSEHYIFILETIMPECSNVAMQHCIKVNECFFFHYRLNGFFVENLT